MTLYVRAALVGALGFALAFGGWHLWQDHSDFHVLIQIEAARQAAGRASNLPGGQNATAEPSSGAKVPSPGTKGGK